MKRRDFFKKGVAGVAATSILPLATSAKDPKQNLRNRSSENWQKMATGKKGILDRNKTAKYDVAVLGGGMAGICAAVSAARNGSQTVLIQDRPVLGGNASSEIRVNLNGVNHLAGRKGAERETGIIEEVQLLNRFRNKQESYPVWDYVMYEYVTKEPNLTLMLNTQAIDAIMDGDSIKAARCWQCTTETEYIIHAKQFIDCSGDGLLAARAGALFRTGREARAEFGETFAPEVADGWQMGASLLFFTEDQGTPQPFEAPHFAVKYDPQNAHPHRKIKKFSSNIWWIEVGSEDDIIAEQENIKDKLAGYVYGVWDYIKNSGEFPEAENHAISWISSVPGKRESRRFIGDHVLSETDLTKHKHFEDAIGYGGWSLDEHNPGGIENLSEPPSYFHSNFKKVYEIPYRSLYSKNIDNLLFAGRNISQTHMALSSTRVMATCAIMGQAAGTAAAICIDKNTNPRGVYKKYRNELQEQLMRDDAFIPNRPANDPLDLAQKTARITASSTESGDSELLVDGISRNSNEEMHHWESSGLPANVNLEWKEPVKISKVEIKCDTNLKRVISLRNNAKRNTGIYWSDIPEEMLKSLTVEVLVNGKWNKVGAIDNNRTRLIKFNFDLVEATAVRINMDETYGAKNAKLFEVRCYKG